MITSKTITDEQIRQLLTTGDELEFPGLKSICQQALQSEANQLREQARAQCASMLNTREFLGMAILLVFIPKNDAPGVIEARIKRFRDALEILGINITRFGSVLYRDELSVTLQGWSFSTISQYEMLVRDGLGWVPKDHDKGLLS
jgi:hypothetical protein